MKGKIINFNKARIMAYMRRYEKTGVLHKNLSRVVGDRLPAVAREFKSFVYANNELKNQRIRKRNNTILDFESDLELLKNNFKTESVEFMFPSILCNYRRGMNPVRALYYELQKTLFQFDKNNHVHIWIIDLFSDKEWSDRLIKSLEIDYNSISKFQQKYLPAASISKDIERKISILNNVKDNLNHFREVFMLMQDTEYRKL